MMKSKNFVSFIHNYSYIDDKLKSGDEIHTTELETFKLESEIKYEELDEKY